ncbi:MAG: alkaline phosphatase family protein, partial [Acidobacteriota bacterium]
KLVVIGLDAVDWEFALPYVEQGLMPNLARLLGQGTWGEMETLVPMLSPLIWTTMATGVSPDQHGILDFVQREPGTGKILPITSNQRQVPAIWNIASALGKTTDVIAWWATWPAEKLNGVMVSDRLYYSLTQGLSAEAYTAERAGVVSPPEREQEFRELRARAVDETDWKAIRYFINLSEHDYLAEIEGGKGWENPVDGFRRTMIATRLYFGSALLLAENHPDLLMVYIEGTDEIGHIMAPYMPPPTLDIAPSRAALLAASVPRYFSAVDRWIGRLVQACPLDEYTILVLSDHGFRWGKTRPTGLSGTAGPTAALWHKQPAIFVLAGKDVASLGRIAERQSVFDVAPTIAAILGIPADAGWPGTPLPGSPSTDLAPIQYAPLVPPASYRTSTDMPAQADPEMIAKLEALGYLSGGGDVPLVSAGEATPIPAPGTPKPTATPLPTDEPQKVTAGQINNLAVIKVNQKKYDEAIDLLNQLIALRPQAPGPHFNLRRIYMETGRYEDADRELWMAIDRGFRDSERTLDRAAADYEVMEMPERAEAILVRAIERFPEHEPFYVHLMVLRIREGRFTEALPVGEVAVEKFPESGPVHAFYGLAAASAGQAEIARREIELSLAINPDQPTLREALEQLP